MTGLVCFQNKNTPVDAFASIKWQLNVYSASQVMQLSWEQVYENMVNDYPKKKQVLLCIITGVK